MTHVEAPDAVRTCPFAAAAVTPTRSRADVVVRRALGVTTTPAGDPPRSAVSTFTGSMLISTIRCSLTYLVFPFVLPALGLVSGAGVVLGVIIGLVAIACNVVSIRRVFAADHRWRWPFATLSLAVIVMLTVLLAQDVVHLVA